MLGIDAKAARYTWTAAAVLLLLGLIYVVRKTLFVFILAVLFAYLLSPLVNLLDKFLPTRTRTAALALAYAILVGVVVFVGIQIGSTVSAQAQAFEKGLPSRIAEFEKPSEKLPASLNQLKAQAIEQVRGRIAGGGGDLLNTLGKAGVQFVTVASDLIYVVIIPILAFFFLK